MTRKSTRDFVHTVIVGAGIVGCSIAYHLAAKGFKDVVLVDRAQTGHPLGSTGHAPGLLAQISSSSTMTELARLSVGLYSALPSDQPAFCRVGSIEVARDEAMLRRFQDKVQRGARADIEARIVGAQDLEKLVPNMDVQGLLGGLYVASDGVLDARRALHGLTHEIVRSGIEIRDLTTVRAIETTAGKVVAVVTDKGRIECERVIVAVGIWGADLMKGLGVELPLFPVQHPYVYTEPLSDWRGETRESAQPFVRDIDNVVYYRQHKERMGYGWYSHEPLTFDMGGLLTGRTPVR
jgi:glycine/D-amino acid oxidase-like deaminating enzyme